MFYLPRNFIKTMNMKKIFTLILCIVSLSVIGQEVIFPSKIESTKQGKQHIRGTHLFIDKPEGYAFVEESTRFQKSATQYFQITEIPFDFNKIKTNLTRNDLEAKTGAKLHYYETVDINGLDGIFFGGSNGDKNEYQGILTFGDEVNTYMIVGVAPLNDNKAFFEVLQHMQSIYYEANGAVNPEELCHFDLDLSITGFKFNNGTATLYVYTPNGKEDGEMAYGIDCMAITEFPLAEVSDQENLIKVLMKKAAGRIDRVVDDRIKKVRINGHNALVLDSKAELDGHKIRLFIGSISLGNIAVIVNGIGYGKGKDYSEIYRKTLGSIKLKQ